MNDYKWHQFVWVTNTIIELTLIKKLCASYVCTLRRKWRTICLEIKAKTKMKVGLWVIETCDNQSFKYRKWHVICAFMSPTGKHKFKCFLNAYRLLRARRALLHVLFNDVPLRTRRVLSLYKFYGDSALLVLNGTLLHNVNALLVLNGTLLHNVNALLVLNGTLLHNVNALLVLNGTLLHNVNALLVLNGTLLHSVNALLVLNGTLLHSVNALLVLSYKTSHMLESCFFLQVFEILSFGGQSSVYFVPMFIVWFTTFS